MAELSPEQVTRIEQGIVRSPYGKLLGVELGELAEDRVSVRMPYRPDNIAINRVLPAVNAPCPT